MSLSQLRRNYFVRMLGYFITHLLLPVFPLAVLTAALTRRSPWYSGEFWLLAALNMGPGLIALGAIWWLAARFVRAVYGLDGIGQSIDFIKRHLFGKVGLRPFMILRGGRVFLDQDGILTRGGPGSLIINNDTAVVLEKIGRLTRVAGPGFHALDPFEKIYDIVDLRPKHWSYPVKAMTREGIPLTWEVGVQYQIDDGGQASTGEAPYPFSEQAVLKAATGKWRRERGRLQELDWEGRVVVGQTEGTLRSIVARRSLDELIGLTRDEGLAAREAIQAELTQELRQAAPEEGVKILDVELDRLAVEDEVTQQWIEAWQTHWQEWSANELANQEAERIEDFEIAKAEAQIAPLSLLTRELGALGSHRDIGSLILMRLISALDRARLENEIFPPGEALEALQRLQYVLEKDTAAPEDKVGPQEGVNPAGGAVSADNGADGSERPGRADAANPADLNGGRTGQNGGAPAPANGRPEPAEKPVDLTQRPASSGKRNTPFRQLPIIGQISAGQERPTADNIIGYMRQIGEFDFEFEGQPFKARGLPDENRLGLSEEYDYVVTPVFGDSMDRAGISAGDYIILQRANRVPIQPTSGDIVAVVFRDEDDKATLKRFKIEWDRVKLKPESSNPAHQPYTLPLTDFTGDSPPAAVVGIATAVLKA